MTCIGRLLCIAIAVCERMWRYQRTGGALARAMPPIPCFPQSSSKRPNQSIRSRAMGSPRGGVGAQTGDRPYLVPRPWWSSIDDTAPPLGVCAGRSSTRRTRERAVAKKSAFWLVLIPCAYIRILWGSMKPEITASRRISAERLFIESRRLSQ